MTKERSTSIYPKVLSAKIMLPYSVRLWSQNPACRHVRSDIPDVRDRRPFYLYVDEFQNFATDSFATILSEARKYGLNLTVANQYISQMSDTVRDVAFSKRRHHDFFPSFADDAPILAGEWSELRSTDLLQMATVILSIWLSAAEKSPRFLPATQTSAACRQHSTLLNTSRRMYSRNREDVEKLMPQ